MGKPRAHATAPRWSLRDRRRQRRPRHGAVTSSEVRARSPEHERVVAAVQVRGKGRDRPRELPGTERLPPSSERFPQSPGRWAAFRKRVRDPARASAVRDAPQLPDDGVSRRGRFLSLSLPPHGRISPACQETARCPQGPGQRFLTHQGLRGAGRARTTASRSPAPHQAGTPDPDVRGGSGDRGRRLRTRLRGGVRRSLLGYAGDAHAGPGRVRDAPSAT